MFEKESEEWADKEFERYKTLEWNKEWWGNGTYCSLTGVIAWKEIVFPKESE